MCLTFCQTQQRRKGSKIFKNYLKKMKKMKGVVADEIHLQQRLAFREQPQPKKPANSTHVPSFPTQAGRGGSVSRRDHNQAA